MGSLGLHMQAKKHPQTFDDYDYDSDDDDGDDNNDDDDNDDNYS